MATDRRVSRVAAMIKREVSQILLYDIKDDRVGTGMVSITDVDVSGDLQHAKIFVSIYGTEEARQETMAGLKSATNHVRSHLGQRMRLRRTPEVIFLEDRSLERGDKMLNLLNQIAQERKPEADSNADSNMGEMTQDMTGKVAEQLPEKVTKKVTEQVTEPLED
ncbi:MAG: 30S ribosome-binding factor RbfA [Oscillatoriales cyanobacterium RM1_1_9]|nr:30S ribosome-binding factor RbfA [Oscillatoriales cyanobacterium SM2_3_0]NJO44670.1 30S ribosome-binding factor RbfA [Oscillatoriales cyanobacterium RM2_1_1]NJO71352.1 30S ribosome-binding factor RbfA [Oscillatoriales cyanobacterium RM1_1_9]